MDWLIDDGEKVILRCQVIRKSQSKKFENVQRKNMIRLFVSEHHL